VIIMGFWDDFPDIDENTCRQNRFIYALLFALVLLSNSKALYGGELKFIPKLEFRESYNDNIYLYSSDIPAMTDLYTTITPEVKFSDRTERLDTFIKGSLNIIRYRVENELDATDQDFIGSLRYRLNERWGMSAEARYTRDSQIDRDIETSGLVLGTAQREHQHYAIQSIYSLTEKTSSNINLAYDKYIFNDPDFVDSQAQEAVIGLTYDLSSILTSSSARINLGVNTYDYTEINVNSYSGLAGISTQLSEAFSISLDAGYQYTLSTFQPEDLTSNEETQVIHSTIGQVALTYRGETSEARLSAYNYVEPISGTAGTTMRSSVRLDLNQRITYKFRAGLSMEYFMNMADQGQQATTNIDEGTWRVQPNLRYDITNDLACEVTYRYVLLNYHGSELDSQQNMVYLRVIWQYPIPH
jgi:hypothetical protein